MLKDFKTNGKSKIFGFKTFLQEWSLRAFQASLRLKMVHSSNIIDT